MNDSTQTALQKTSPVVQSLAKQFDYTEDFVQTVKDVFAKGASDNELKLFLQTAKRTGLDPFARQIYCIKRYDSIVGSMVMSAQVSIDGFRLIADRTGRYVPSKEPTYTFDADGNLESATAYLKKLVAGTWHEVSATAFFSEYVQTKKDGTPNSMWKKMPRLMLAKCAESLVLRKAFPAELSGLYTAEEMGTVIGENTPETNSHTTPGKELVEKPSFAADSQDKQLADLCSRLNEANDSIKWSAKQLTEYANELLDTELDSFLMLDAEKKEVLLGDLQGRFDEISERAAIETEVVEGEIFDQNEEAAF